jgi:NAD(P)-dependent dehydrogenase (short-subunit alcohol dehydrogenase family)
MAKWTTADIPSQSGRTAVITGANSGVGFATGDDASTPQVLAEIADLVAAGACDFDIAATVPTDQVADAFDELERRHTHGKIVLLPQARTEQTQS